MRKGTIKSISVLLLAFALITTSAVFVDGSDAKSDEAERKPAKEVGPDLENNTERPDMKRIILSVRENYTGRIPREFSNWEHLPRVKNIFTSGSPGRWMINEIGQNNSNISVRDRDNDTIPEMVIWRQTFLFNRTIEVEIENRTLNWTAKGRGIFLLIYIDRDDDANPELLLLHVHEAARVDTNGDGSYEGKASLEWRGTAVDRDDDGKWDHQSFRTGAMLLIDRDRDKNPEIKARSAFSYKRNSLPNSTVWNGIAFSYSRGYSVDRDDDSNPEVVVKIAVKGSWVDRNGDGWPEMIRGSRSKGKVSDPDSDGNVDLASRTSFSLDWINRNGDRHPEVLRISFVRTILKDRDDDGDFDVMNRTTKGLIWIDLNSDGRPETYRIWNNSSTRELPEDVKGGRQERVKGGRERIRNIRERVKERVGERGQKRDGKNTENDESNQRSKGE